MQVLDLTGQVFGRLTVLGVADTPYINPKTGRKSKKWRCKCSCPEGKIIEVVTGNLRRKDKIGGRSTRSTKSCGCLARDILIERLATGDLTGKKFGRLTAIELATTRYISPKDGRQHTKWKCVCECGKVVEVARFSLTTNHTKSCGCLLKTRKYTNSWQISFNKLYGSYEANAKKRHLLFELTEEQCHVLFKSNCSYCGAEPFNIYNPYIKKDGTHTKAGEFISFDKTEYGYKFNGIDRIDNKTGYLLNNCTPCCIICNTGKRSMDPQEWENYLAQVTQYRLSQMPTEQLVIMLSKALNANENKPFLKNFIEKSKQGAKT